LGVGSPIYPLRKDGDLVAGLVKMLQPKVVVLGLRNRRYPSSNLSLNQPMPACPLLLTPTFLPSLRLTHTLLLLSLMLTAYRSLPFCYCDDKQASDTLSRYFCRNLQKGDFLPSSRSAYLSRIYARDQRPGRAIPSIHR
jgi:hypothetical protein